MDFPRLAPQAMSRGCQGCARGCPRCCPLLLAGCSLLLLLPALSEVEHLQNDRRLRLCPDTHAGQELIRGCQLLLLHAAESIAACHDGWECCHMDIVGLASLCRLPAMHCAVPLAP